MPPTPTTDKTPVTPKLRILIKECDVAINQDNCRRLSFLEPLFDFIPDLAELAAKEKQMAEKKVVERSASSEDDDFPRTFSRTDSDYRSMVKQIQPDIKVVRIRFENLIIEGE